MVTRRKGGITDALRARILAALRAGALDGGDRLPSTRELAADFAADPRVVADAYRALAAEGLVELRPRAGAFVAPLRGLDGAEERRAAPSAAWLARVVGEGACRGVPSSRLAAVIAGATTVRRMSAAVVAITLDQAVGIARELADDYGMDARAFVEDQLVRGEALPRGVARAHVLVGTELTAQRVRRLAERLGKHAVVIDPRPDLLSPEWRLLLRGPAYVVVADPRFRPLVYRFLEGAPGAGPVRVLLAGRDDLAEIPADAPTYVTEAARQRLGRTRLPGRLVTPVRTLCDDSVHELAALLVAHNLAGERRAARSSNGGA